MRWYRFGTDFFVCDCEKRKMYWMYIEFFGKKQAGKDVPKMCRRINQRFLNRPYEEIRFFKRLLDRPALILLYDIVCAALHDGGCRHQRQHSLLL